VFDLFVSRGISPVGIVITSGTAETHHRMTWSVPKLTLVSRLQALLHEGRLKILRELAEAESLVCELKDFRGEFTAAGHLTFNARTGKHDDLVLALAIAVWRAHGGGFVSWGVSNSRAG
jgi:hypothetical protein